MEKITLSFLTAKHLPQLYQTFLAAFADYLIPIQLSWEQFLAKVKREGVEPSFCVAAYAGDQMVGFILTGLGEWQGRPTAYNAGTGVVPAFRGRAITQQLYQFLLPKLRASGIEQCLLEVIQQNTPALKSYERTGFRITRSLDCFRAPKEELILKAVLPEEYTVSESSRADWPACISFWDVEPTWQNLPQAVKHSTGMVRVLEAKNKENELVGYTAFLPQNGSVMQLAVREESRNQGVGTALLRAAAAGTEVPALMFINVDAAADKTISFLQRRHLKRILQQHEMLMPL